MNISTIVTTELLGQINAKHAPHYYAVANALNHPHYQPLYALIHTPCETIKIQQRLHQPQTAGQITIKTIIQLFINDDTIALYDLSGNIPYNAPNTILDLADPQSIPKTLQLIKQIINP